MSVSTLCPPSLSMDLSSLQLAAIHDYLYPVSDSKSSLSSDSDDKDDLEPLTICDDLPWGRSGYDWQK